MTSKTYLVAALITCLVAACGGDAADQSSGSTSEAVSAMTVRRADTGTPTKLALLVGINTYPKLSKFSQLEGAVNDVERMRTLLTTTYDFPPENLQVLVDGNATRDNILAAFRQHLVANATAGDIVVFHYSGHGSQLNDDQDGDESDGLDETLVPSDSDREGTRDIRDDELNALIAELDPAVQVTLIFDSCHSGTVTRDVEGGRARSLDRDSLLTQRVSTRGASQTEGLSTPDMSYVLLSGARSDQLAKEFEKNGQSYGALTYFLTETLSQADSAMTYTDLRDIVQGQIATRFADQNPQLEGPSSSNFVFSETSSLAQPHVLVHPLEDAARVEVQAGKVHGMTVGSVFEIYPPGTKRFDVQSTPIARAKITQVEAFTSEAELLSGGPVPAAARAVEREHAYTDQQMKLRFEGLASSPLLRAVKDTLGMATHIQAIAEDSEDFDLRLFEANGALHIQHDEVVFSEPVPVDAPDAVRRAVGQVEQWAKWFNIWAIDDAASISPVKLILRVEDTNRDDTRPWNEVEEGGSLFMSFENQSEQDLFITGIGLFSSGAIQSFYPGPGSDGLLKAGTKSREIQAIADPVAEGRPFSRDILKVFATTTQVNLSNLIQDKIRGGPDDPLAALVAQAAHGTTRDFTPVEVGEWYTTQQALIVRRASRPAM